MNCIIGFLVIMFVTNIVSLAMLLIIDHKINRGE